MHNGVPIFKPGDMILVASGPFHSGDKVKAQIVAIRHEISNHRTGERDCGCDVITEEKEAKFFWLADIVRWNQDRVAEWFRP